MTAALIIRVVRGAEAVPAGVNAITPSPGGSTRALGIRRDSGILFTLRPYSLAYETDVAAPRPIAGATRQSSWASAPPWALASEQLDRDTAVPRRPPTPRRRSDWWSAH